jgi:SulP family sulfate permease
MMDKSRLHQKIHTMYTCLIKRSSEISKNILVALTVSFVALSLGAAFGVLSGRGAFAGMFSAGLIAAITAAIGGTRVQCSGPTAPMAAIMAIVVANTGLVLQNNADYLHGMTPAHWYNLICLVCGVIMILMGVLRLGKWISYIPDTVISGFMTGIGIMIWTGQGEILLNLGGQTSYGGTIDNLFLAFSTLALTFASYPLLKRISPILANFIPGTLTALIVMTAISYQLDMPVAHTILDTTINSWQGLLDYIQQQIPQNISMPVLTKALPISVELALISYLDTLMVALIIDRMTGEKTHQNKELIAQGVANSAVAFIGGVPGTQASIRSVMMIQEGATMRFAGIMVGIFVLIQMFAFQGFLGLIPKAVFSGILLKVDWNVIDKKPLTDFILRRDDAPSVLDFITILGTALVTLYNLSLAVLIFTSVHFILGSKHKRGQRK